MGRSLDASMAWGGVLDAKMVKQHTAPAGAEVSRAIAVDRIDDEGLDMEISATDAERAALAERFDLISLDRLEARVSLRREADGSGVQMALHLIADVVQPCVVTLEPVGDHIEDAAGFLFVRAEDMPEPSHDADEELAEGEEEDAVEPYFDNTIDVGEVVSEHLAILLNPYPRKPGVTLKDRAEELAGIVTIDEDDSASEEEKENPFAVLKQLTRTNRANT
jgi:uncharacterized metal-binding protein YceD (DUF177 family)